MRRVAQSSLFSVTLSTLLLPTPSVFGKGPIQIQVKAEELGTAISDLVYGKSDLSFGVSDSELAYPIVRFGGNSTSRYNWQENAWNTGKDWYFLNIAMPYVSKVNGFNGNFSYTDAIILKQSSLGLDTLITIPMLGWVAKDRNKGWSYPVKTFGKQQAVESEQSMGDAGNGRKADGSQLRKGNPLAISRPAPPEFMAEWVKHNQQLNKKYSSKGPGVRFYALDNEPMLWHETHQDIRSADPSVKQALMSYDELWQRTVAYASAIRKADPQAKILGPAEWGWCSYLSSAQDKCKNGPDRAAHGGKAFLPWYLKQVCDYQKKTGIRLVDYLDIHYYPATESSFEDESKEAQRLRFMAVRSLYEKDFLDGSWIDEPIALIPRMKQWIREECPGTQLAITEYRFGAKPDGLSSTLANAEALAIFGKQGLDLGTFWGHIPKGSKLEGAFALYLNYDGKGASARSGRSVSALSSASLDLPAYAIKTKDRLLVYVFNKTDQNQPVTWAGLNGWLLKRRFKISASQNLAEQKVVSGEATQLEAFSAHLFEWTKK